MDFYRHQLRDQRHRLPPHFTYHCVDVYFAKKKYLDEAVRLDLHPITKLRCDADCQFLYTGPHPKRRMHGVSMMAKSIFKTSACLQFLVTMAEAEHLHLYTAVVLARHAQTQAAPRGRGQPEGPSQAGATSCWPPLIWP